MKNTPIKINGTGCALADYLYTNVTFNSLHFSKYRSLKSGDGGLNPGKLVFTEELEKFAKKSYSEILNELTGNENPDSFNIGGPGLVPLIHASQLLPGPEFEVCFFGILGSDNIARQIFEIVNNTPLDISNYKNISSRATSFTDVFSDPTYDEGQGERMFVNNIGAAWDYSPDLLSSNFFEADIICFGGTALVPNIHDNLTSLLNIAKKNKAITLVNTVFDFRNEKKNPNMLWPLGNSMESYKLIDVLIMDMEEALKISGKMSLELASEYFVMQGLSTFIITNGSKDVVAYSNGALFKKIGISKFPVSAEIVEDLRINPSLKGDTTGCGDNFAGGIIASLAWQLRSKEKGNFDLIEALSWAIASGGFACFYIGGTYLEKYPLEKYKKLSYYQTKYLAQYQLK
jgi:sugar/nucleoside kinase (ribokinase family)